MVATLAEAVADCRLVLGCTARARRVQLEEYLPADAAARAVAKAGEGAEVALVFGRERTGLTNEELQLCHAAVHIPSDPEFSSLNLAAAVQVLAYETRMQLLGAQPVAETEPGFREQAASHEQMESFFAQLGDTLDEIDFHKGRAPSRRCASCAACSCAASPPNRKCACCAASSPTPSAWRDWRRQAARTADDVLIFRVVCLDTQGDEACVGSAKGNAGGLLSLAMVLLAGTVRAAPDPVLVLGRISDDPKAHYEQLQPLLDYVVARMHDVGIQEGRILMARDPQQMASYLRRGRVDWVTETSGTAVALGQRSGARPCC